MVQHVHGQAGICICTHTRIHTQCLLETWDIHVSKPSPLQSSNMLKFSKFYHRHTPKRDLLSQHIAATSGMFLAERGWNRTIIPGGQCLGTGFLCHLPLGTRLVLSRAGLVDKQMSLSVEDSCPSRSHSRSLQVELYHLHSHVLKNNCSRRNTPTHPPSHPLSLGTLVTPFFCHTIKNAGWIHRAF